MRRVVMLVAGIMVLYGTPAFAQTVEDTLQMKQQIEQHMRDVQQKSRDVREASRDNRQARDNSLVQRIREAMTDLRAKIAANRENQARIRQQIRDNRDKEKALTQDTKFKLSEARIQNRQRLQDLKAKSRP